MSLPGRRAVNRKPRRVLRWPEALLAISLTALIVLGLMAFYRPFQSKARAGTLPFDDTSGAGEQTQAPPPVPLPGKRTTFLVMGVDKRPDDPGRSDSMIVVSYDSSTDQIAMLSLPRDTWAQIPGHGYDKINHSYAYGGEALAVKAVQRLLGIPIDHYVTLSFQGFQQIIDAIGGVDVDAEKRLLYSDPYDTGMGPGGLEIDIQPGPQHMDGLTALKYSRYRADDEGDFGRMRRQQQVAKAAITAAARPAVLTRLPQLIPAVAQALTTDLSLADMLKFSMGARSALNSPLRTGTLTGADAVVGGIYYLIPDLKALRTKAYQTLVGGDPPGELVRRAEEEQKVYDQTLAEARAAAQQAGTGGGGTGTAPGTGTQPGTGKPGTGAGGSGGATGGAPKPRQQPITVAVIDASGRKLGAAYVAKFKAAGFRVARTGTLKQTLAKTTVMDHAGQPGTAERIRPALPVFKLISAPNQKAAEALEIILGADLP